MFVNIVLEAPARDGTDRAFARSDQATGAPSAVGRPFHLHQRRQCTRIDGVGNQMFGDVEDFTHAFT